MTEATPSTAKTISIQGIMDLLPHRYPILLVDRILDYEPGQWIRGVKNITMGDPIFQGHFPSRAVFPGVLMVEAMAQTGGCLVLLALPDWKDKLMYFMSIDKVKFRRPVVPGDQLVMTVEMISCKGRICKLRGTATVDGQKAVEAEFMSMLVDAEKGQA